VLAIVVLVPGIAQGPALLVTLPALGYIGWSGDHGNVKAIIHSALIFTHAICQLRAQRVPFQSADRAQILLA
jgi:hypothetical protein